MVSKLVGNTMGALTVAAGLARHLAWYVSYQLDGTARVDEAPGKLKQPSS